jgi:hypothetical protein
MTRGGLPHSDISGSKLICSSPELIAACHVLHRLLAPRHSPYTLSSLTIRNSGTDADWLRTLGSRLQEVPEVWSLKPEVFPRKSLCNTACVVVGKNYRLQNIQLSKIKLGASPPDPARSLVGPQRPPPLPRKGISHKLRSLAGNRSAVGPLFATLKSRI